METNHRPLLIVAAPAEAKAVLAGLGISAAAAPWSPIRTSRRFDVVASGIGKSNAAGATAKFGDISRHSVILSVGVAGALPESGLTIGDTVIASAVAHADDGIQTPDRFIDCSEMGFPLGDFTGAALPVHTSVVGWLRSALAPLQPRVGTIATLSTCSGTDTLARQVRERTGGVAECMEGAAVGLVAHRLGVPFGELRVISNTTGDRDRQVWDLKQALDGLARVIGLLARAEGFPG